MPQSTTCIAWSWIGEDKVEVVSTGQAGFFDRELRRPMLEAFLEAYNEADMVTGHNLIRFDLPVLNSEYLRLGLPPLGEKLVQDTMRMPKSKGFKRGLDNLAALYDVPAEKLAMNHQQWQDAYADPSWAEVEKRAATDVVLHKLVRQALLDRGHLKPPMRWKS